MKLKQILLLTACFLFIFIISGCGQKNGINNTKNNQSSQTSTKKTQEAIPDTEVITQSAQTVNQENQIPKSKTFAELKEEIQPSKYLTFSSSIYGYSFIYPDNWTKIPATKQIPINIVAPTGGANMNFACADYTKIDGYEKMAAEVNDIAILVVKMDPQLESSMKGYQRISRTIITQNGVKVAKTYFKTLVGNDVPAKVMQTSMVKDGIECTITYLAEEKVYDLYQDIAERSSASLTAK